MTNEISPNTIEINTLLSSIDTFDEKIITKAGFKLKTITMQGEAQLSSMCFPEIVVDADYRIGTTQLLRQRYCLPKICNKFKSRLKAIKENLPNNVVISIRTISIIKGKDTYCFRVYGKKIRTVILRFKNGNTCDNYNVADLMKELCELFETTCHLNSGKYIAPLICGLKIK